MGMLVGSYCVALRETRPPLSSLLQQPICGSSWWVLLLLPRPVHPHLVSLLGPAARPHSTQQPPLGHFPAGFVQLCWSPCISWNTLTSPLPQTLGTCSSAWTACQQPSQGFPAIIGSSEGIPSCPVDPGPVPSVPVNHSGDCPHTTLVAVLFIASVLVRHPACPLEWDIR